MVLSPWVAAGLVTAVVQSIKAFLQKKLVEDVSGLELSFVASLYTALLMLPVAGFYLFNGVAPSPAIWAAIAFVGTTNGIALLLFFSSLKIEDLSVASPLKQTIPLFVAALEPLVLATGYSVDILSGALLTAAGSYVLMFEGDDLLKPIQMIGKPGPLMALASAFFFGIGAVAVKYVVSNVPVLFFVSIVFWFSALTIGVAVYLRSDIEMKDYRAREYVYLGLFTAMTQALIFLTIDLSSASEATILFRLSILFNVLIGFRLFDEENLYYRLIGAALIIAGIAFIVI